MKVCVENGVRSGKIAVPSSKSLLHRLLICAARAQNRSIIEYSGLSKDIVATAECLKELGAQIGENIPGLLDVHPIGEMTLTSATLNCGESGSTLRFMLPFVGSYGINCNFRMEGRLPKRPLAPFDEELKAHGMQIARRSEHTADVDIDYDVLHCNGQLKAGAYTIPGDISSQYVSALLMTLPMLDGDSTLEITGKIESAPYIAMTEGVLRNCGIIIERQNIRSYRIPGNQVPEFPFKTEVEGDWSNAAFFLCMGALSPAGILVKGLSSDSAQGDREILGILLRMGAVMSVEEGGVRVSRGSLRGIELDAGDVPDLVPAIASLASVCAGQTRIVDAGRLRMKESDRLHTTTEMLKSLGANIKETEDGLIIEGRSSLQGGTCSSFGDHRIAMAAALAASACDAPVVIEESEAVDKSYPRFFQDLEKLKVLK